MYLHYCSYGVGICRTKTFSLSVSDELIKEAENLRKEKERMEAEMNDVKATAVLAEQTYREEVEEVRAQWKSEVGSMQQIMTSKYVGGYLE